MFSVIISILIAGTAATDIIYDRMGRKAAVYVFKPLTIALAALLAAIGPREAAVSYRFAVVSGLVCSLAGDTFLMLPRKRVLPGLLSFLLAHLSYIAAFLCSHTPNPSIYLVIPFLVYFSIMYSVLFTKLGKMKVPVFIYQLVITAMAWLAAERFGEVGTAKTLFALIGAALFVISDSIWGINRFVHTHRNAQPLILTTYFCAQWLIALSV